MKYSYQYTIKILGLPQRNPRESALESAKICLNLFHKLGANSVTLSDIDIAHRIANRRPSNFPPAIVCKFTRRLAKEEVMNCKREASKVDAFELVGQDLDYPGQIKPKVMIFDHLTPRTQQLLRDSKEFQQSNNYKYCWTKNSTVYLREDDGSTAIKITGPEVLQRLQENS